jgi:hypothetical protein
MSLASEIYIVHLCNITRLYVPIDMFAAVLGPYIRALELILTGPTLFAAKLLALRVSPFTLRPGQFICLAVHIHRIASTFSNHTTPSKNSCHYAIYSHTLSTIPLRLHRSRLFYSKPLIILLELLYHEQCMQRNSCDGCTAMILNEVPLRMQYVEYCDVAVA